MAKSKPSAEACSADTGQLTSAVNNLAEQVKVLREALDDFREIFRWAVQNDRFRSPDSEQFQPQLQDSSDGSPPEPIERQRRPFAEVVQESLRDVGDDLAEVVRDELPQQLADLRDAVDQFSLDIQWAARQVRSAVTDRPTGCAHVPEDDAPIDDTGPPNDPKPPPEPADSGMKNTVAAGNRQSFLWQPE